MKKKTSLLIQFIEGIREQFRQMKYIDKSFYFLIKKIN